LARDHATYISISAAQRRSAPGLRFAGTVYNGIDVASFPFSADRGSYLAFLGRVSPDKGLDIAIRTAQEVGVLLKIAAKVDVAQRPWFDEVIAPLVKRGGVDLIGEITAGEKGQFLKGALALMHPSRWSEPFGLAVVEAMACGFPVLTLNRGAAAELVEHGRTGFVVDDETALASAIGDLHQIDRSACRSHVAAKFDRRLMAEQYEKLALTMRNNQSRPTNAHDHS
jgi:glycosyltransferase involved in cell wall biosynthesis